MTKISDIQDVNDLSAMWIASSCTFPHLTLTENIFPMVDLCLETLQKKGVKTLEKYTEEGKI